MTAAAKKPKPVAEREITITRTFDAPRPLVFSMFTDARHLARWWGPHTFTNPVCKTDPQPGGKVYIDMQGPDGTVHPMWGIYDELIPHDRIVLSTFVDMPDGQRVLEGRNVITFEDHLGGTRVTVRASAQGFVAFAPQMLAGMEAGWSQSLDKLATTAERESGRKDVDDRAAIRALLADRTNALFGKVVDLATTHLAGDLVSYDLDPPLQHVGVDAARMRSWFETWDGPISFVVDDLRIEVGGDIAIARGLGHMTGVKTGGQAVDLWVRCTVGLGRRDGVWTITHQHTSVPFHMDGSFKAAVELKP
jgi:uncharacterized protein YndB with AHSA1/START domain/ketosteroid isomerase-like protein